MISSSILRPDATLSVVTPETLSTEATLGDARAQAIKAGYAEGFATGIEQARLQADASRAKADEDVKNIACLLSSAIEQATIATEREQACLEKRAVTLAIDIAEAILEREVETSTSPGADAIVRALRCAPHSSGAIVRANPLDAEILAAAPAIAGVGSIVSDASIKRGGCLLEVGAAIVDARLETAIARIRAVLQRATDLS